MATFSLVAKDIREHRLAAFCLCLASLIVVVLLLAQNKAAAYSMSPFEIVRFSLVGFIPLLALIVGNRLIVREYLSGTRLFVEALPVGTVLPLVIKYCLGFLFISSIAGAMVLLASRQASIADDVTSEYLQLILGKTLVMALLYWSIVFCFSLCGYLRVALYLVLAGVVLLLAFYPGIDSTDFAPFALMDNQLFVFERDIIPWNDIHITLLLSLVFTLAGFILTRVGEGSLVERLAKPMTRRDYVALGVLAAAGLAIGVTLVDSNQRQPIEFSSTSVVRLADPDVSVLYLEPQYEAAAIALAERTSQSLTNLQATLGLTELPTVRVALSPSREKHDIDYATHDGVFITSNWLEHDGYDNTILDSVLLHGVMSILTNGRGMFEPYHWVLDGFTRWWAEQGNSPLVQAHANELIARALLVVRSFPEAFDLVANWQLTADRFSYPSAEALAWVAMSYLEETQGRDAVLQLAREFLVEPMGSTALDVLKDRRLSVAQRFEQVLSMPLSEFETGWKSWLEDQSMQPEIVSLLGTVPAWQGKIVTERDENGVHRVDGLYERLDEPEQVDENFSGQCIMKHEYIGPFDTEFDVSDDYEDIAECRLNQVVHSIASVYAPGDRVFVALDYEGGSFHQPIRLHAERVHVP